MVLLLQCDSECPAGIIDHVLAERGQATATLQLEVAQRLPEDDVEAVVLLGGAMGVYDDARYPFLPPLKDWLQRMIERDVPMLGICLGGQLLAHLLGGAFLAGTRGEKGMTSLVLTTAGRHDPLFVGLPPSFDMFQWHNDSFDPPPGSLHLAASVDCPGQAFRHGPRWGVQFHPEVTPAIVAHWCRSGGEKFHADAFAAVAACHQALARRLLANFFDAAAGGVAPDSAK